MLYFFCRQLEVIVNGRRQGCTKKNSNKPSNRLMISKIGLFQQFMQIIEQRPLLKTVLKINSNDSYKCVKEKSVEYRSAWLDIEKNIFKNWTTKPSDRNDFQCIVNKI